MNLKKKTWYGFNGSTGNGPGTFASSNELLICAVGLIGELGSNAVAPFDVDCNK